MVKALVVCGDGINCETESAFALEQAGASASICHINALIEAPEKLRATQLLFLPGGFSFGDEISSGKVLGVKLQHALGEPLAEFVASGKVVIGVCNGFQALVKMGLLPNTAPGDGEGHAQQVTLSHNRQGRFINRWVWLKANPNNPFFKGLDRMMLPIRHGEGRLRVPAGSEPQWQKALAPPRCGHLRHRREWGLFTNRGPDQRRGQRAGHDAPPRSLCPLDPAPGLDVAPQRHPSHHPGRFADFNQRGESLKERVMAHPTLPPSTYEAAGVNVALGDAFVGRIKALAKARGGHPLQAKMLQGAGGYAAVCAVTDQRWVALTTDGVGTKVLLAHELGQVAGVGY
jgi:phosphoribosylformylglycinamidine (FGAM) synthase-like amidotransferase family enzyme